MVTCVQAYSHTLLHTENVNEPEEGVSLKVYLVVEGTDVQGCVSRGILGTHVGPIEQQVLQVLHVSKAAGLRRREELKHPRQRGPQPGPSPGPLLT